MDDVIAMVVRLGTLVRPEGEAWVWEPCRPHGRGKRRKSGQGLDEEV
jgi:hypothetical protein